MRSLDKNFYARDTLLVAKDLIGKVICRKYKGVWLIETEAYLMREKGSHSSLGYTEKEMRY